MSLHVPVRAATAVALADEEHVRAANQRAGDEQPETALSVAKADAVGVCKSETARAAGEVCAILRVRFERLCGINEPLSRVHQRLRRDLFDGGVVGLNGGRVIGRGREGKRGLRPESSELYGAVNKFFNSVRIIR